MKGFRLFFFFWENFDHKVNSEIGRYFALKWPLGSFSWNTIDLNYSHKFELITWCRKKRLNWSMFISASRCYSTFFRTQSQYLFSLLSPINYLSLILTIRGKKVDRISEDATILLSTRLTSSIFESSRFAWCCSSITRSESLTYHLAS